MMNNDASHHPECPHCRSRKHTRSYPVIFEQETGSAVTTGSFHGFGLGDELDYFSGGYRSQTFYASRLASSTRPPDVPPTVWGIGGCLIGLGTVVCLIIGLLSFKTMVVGFLILGAFIKLAQFVHNREYPKQYREYLNRYREWENTYYCLRCGFRFRVP